jgi:hypothetical protein
MIRVTGTAKLRVNYEVQLDMTEDEFDAMSERSQNELLDNMIDWKEACRSAELDDLDVDDLVEV